MQTYTTVVDILDTRGKNFNYLDCRAYYHLGKGTVKLIIDSFSETGLLLSDLKQMEPQKMEQLFYPPENIKRKAPLLDYQKIYDRLTAKR